MKQPVRQRLLAAALALVTAVAVFLLATLRKEIPSTPVVTISLEVNRTNLVWLAGRWEWPGRTGGFTGVLLETYEDGARKSRSSVSNGLLQGVSMGWHTNGQPQVEEHFKAGISHGLRTKWHSNGTKLSEAGIVDGKLDGIFQRWDEHGTLTEEVEMKDGQPDGLSRAYFPSGYLKAQVRLRQGLVVEQTFWNDGEHSEVAARGGVTSSRR